MAARAAARQPRRWRYLMAARVPRPACSTATLLARGPPCTRTDGITRRPPRLIFKAPATLRPRWPFGGFCCCRLVTDASSLAYGNASPPRSHARKTRGGSKFEGRATPLLAGRPGVGARHLRRLNHARRAAYYAQSEMLASSSIAISDVRARPGIATRAAFRALQLANLLAPSLAPVGAGAGLRSERRGGRAVHHHTPPVPDLCNISRLLAARGRARGCVAVPRPPPCRIRAVQPCGA